MTRSYRAIDPARLTEQLAELLHAAPTPGAALRVAIDGPACAGTNRLADSLGTPLRILGRPARTIRAETFWRDAALRLEYGREDVESFATWLDDPALRREVLDPLGPGGSGKYLPSLRDLTTNRATREPPAVAPSGAIVIVAGELLLGRRLPFDRTIHLALSPAARTRRTDPAHAWTLPAHDRYEAEVRPSDLADVVVRYDDPEHPAISF